jgi:serine/threonine protein kinase
MHPVGTTLARRYRLDRLIGDGGMAAVFEASDLLLGRRVAVKVLHHRLVGDPAFLARFWQEAQAAAGIAHPSVVAVYDFGEHDGTPFIVLELIHGEPLDMLLAREGRLSPERAVAIAAGVCDALQAAHARGLVHRDVKPANVMVGPDGSVKVMDFGLARAAEAACGLTDPGTVVGTAYYIAPEQAVGGQAGTRSDLYALGVCLYEMLGGERPFSGSGPVDIAVKHVSGVPRRLDELRPDLPPALVAAVHQALAKRPEDRQPSAMALRECLARAVMPVPSVDATDSSDRDTATAPLPFISAPDPGTGQDHEWGAGGAGVRDPAGRGRRARRGRRRALALTAIIVFALVTGSVSVVSLWKESPDVSTARDEVGGSFTQPTLREAGGPAGTPERAGRGGRDGAKRSGGGAADAAKDRDRLDGRADSGPPLKESSHGKKDKRQKG